MAAYALPIIANERRVMVAIPSASEISPGPAVEFRQRRSLLV
jgi:hypothetical protein